MKDITTRIAGVRPNDTTSARMQGAARKMARETRGGAIQLKFRSELSLPGRPDVTLDRTWVAVCRTAEAMDYVRLEIARLFKRLDGCGVLQAPATAASVAQDVRAEFGQESIAVHARAS